LKIGNNSILYGAECLLQERRTALISAAVTGKIDVRDWDSPKDQEVSA
jgi:type I restriction enzyme S subunit